MADVDKNTEPAAVAFYLSRVLRWRGFCHGGQESTLEWQARRRSCPMSLALPSLIGERIHVDLILVV